MEEAVKSLTSLWRELANESASWCDTSALRDYKTVVERTEVEGDSFLTITLPAFCKSFERSLECGSIADVPFPGFRKRSGLPVFLRGFLLQIFSASGSLLDVPSVDCIRAIRQLTLVFAKIERPCSTARVARAMQQYVEIEAELRAFDTSSFEEFLPLFQKASTLLWADVFSHVENSLLDTHHLADEWVERPSVSASGGDIILHLLILPSKNRNGEPMEKFIEPLVVIDPAGGRCLVPRHGPGSTADGLRGNAKFDNVVWPERLESVFPYGENALPSWRHHTSLTVCSFSSLGRRRL